MAAMAYDPVIGKLVLFGFPFTFSSSSRFETWTYNGTTWARESPAGPIPAHGQPRAWPLGPMVYDAALGRIVLYAGATWTYDGAAWTEQPAAPISNLTWGMSMAYNPTMRQTVLFGGLGLDPNNRSAAEGPPINGTWTYNGNNWTRQSPSAAPPPRHSAVMAYDPTVNSLVLFGGTYDNTELADTWTYR
jgi:hypothetical protein